MTMESTGADAPTRVLLVAGAGRSGSTMLGNILGSLEGAFCGGEIRYLWERGVRDDRHCGCGRPFSRCPVWSEILAVAGCAPGRLDVYRLIAGAANGTRIRHLPGLFAKRRRDKPPDVESGGFADHMARIYRAIPTVTGCSLVVDTSKLPTYGYLLGHLPAVDLFVVHLVRDPRATAYSWGRKKALADGAPLASMQRQSPAKAALLWDVWNVAARELWRRAPQRYLRVGYEDFVARPRGTVERILEFVEHDSDAAAVFRGERTVSLRVTHTVAGNPDRLRRGDVTLRLDDEWSRKMRWRDRALVTALTAPLLPGFGLRSTGGSQAAARPSPEGGT